MKKVFLFASVVAFIGLTSCKKDYTCQCTGDNEWTQTIPIDNAKKSDAEDICDAANATYSSFGANCSLD